MNAAADQSSLGKKPGFEDTARLLAVLLIAVVLRGVALLIFGDELGHDRDLYLGIAENLAEGNGFSTPGTTDPTAYRPPLYPLVLAGVMRLGGGTAAIGVLHLVLSTATVALTWHLGRTLGLGRGAVWAAGLVAVDPILVQYTALPMTETLCTFLVMLLLAVSPERWTARNASLGVRNPVFGEIGFRAFIIGVLFGLCVLCRPTVWAFGVLAAAWWLAAEGKKPGFEEKAGLPRPARTALR
ncbi:MAG: ArnT family glycosyltransferase, partial [Planctomycetaceae bacterium]